MKDALNRRKRYAASQPQHSKIVLQERDILIFEAIDRHGQLPSNYLHMLTRHQCADISELKRRLTQLYNGYCVGEGEHVCAAIRYLNRDRAQKDSMVSLSQHLVYQLTPRAKRYLLEHGRASLSSPKRNDPFEHQLFGACLSASFELQANGFVSRERMLAHPKCPDSTKKNPTPFSIPLSTGVIIPDNIFGIEFPEGGFRFFAVEIDRNTESIRSNKVTNTIERKIEAYLYLMETNGFTQRFGIPNFHVLLATTNHAHLENMIGHLHEKVPARLHKRFLFKAFPDFGEDWRVPREVLPVLEQWRSPAGDVDISKKASA